MRICHKFLTVTGQGFRKITVYARWNIPNKFRHVKHCRIFHSHCCQWFFQRWICPFTQQQEFVLFTALKIIVKEFFVESRCSGCVDNDHRAIKPRQQLYVTCRFQRLWIYVFCVQFNFLYVGSIQLCPVNVWDLETSVNQSVTQSTDSWFWIVLLVGRQAVVISTVFTWFINWSLSGFVNMSKCVLAVLYSYLIKLFLC